MATNIKPCLSAGLIATGAVIMIALYGSDHWLEPMMPLMLGAAAALPLSIVGALLLHPEARSAPSRFLAIGLTVLVGALVGVGVPAMWTVPDVRIAVAKAASTSVDLYGALEDPEGKVQLEACRQLIADDSQVERLSDALSGTPRLANRCLSSASSAKLVGAVASNLESDWYDQLLTQTSTNSDDQCLQAQALSALPIQVGIKQADLLNCALRSASAPNRVCCAESLVSINDSCESLASSIDTGKVLRAGTAADLMALSMGEATATREFDEAASRIELTCDEMQMVGVQLACVALSGEQYRTRAQQVLDWLLDENQSCLSTERRASSVPPEQVCDTLMEYIKREGKLDGDVVCQSHRMALDEQAAYLEQIKGLSQAESAALADQISAGNARASDEMMNLENFAAAARSNRGEGLKAYSKEQARKMMQQVRQQAMSPEELSTKPFENLAQIQDTATKMIGKDEAAARFKESGEAPDMEALEKETEKGLERVKGATEFLKAERAKSEQKHRRDHRD